MKRHLGLLGRIALATTILTTSGKAQLSSYDGLTLDELKAEITAHQDSINNINYWIAKFQKAIEDVKTHKLEVQAEAEKARNDWQAWINQLSNDQIHTAWAGQHKQSQYLAGEIIKANKSLMFVTTQENQKIAEGDKLIAEARQSISKLEDSLRQEQSELNHIKVNYENRTWWKKQ